MKLILAIGTGSFIGGVFRYLLSQFIQSRTITAFPFGTLAVNLIGCFFIGLVFALSERGSISQEWRMVLAIGVLGGFTTFSAFSNETFLLVRSGQALYAFTYIAASVLLGLLATYLGYAILKMA